MTVSNNRVLIIDDDHRIRRIISTPSKHMIQNRV